MLPALDPDIQPLGYIAESIALAVTKHHHSTLPCSNDNPNCPTKDSTSWWKLFTMFLVIPGLSCWMRPFAILLPVIFIHLENSANKMLLPSIDGQSCVYRRTQEKSARSDVSVVFLAVSSSSATESFMLSFPRSLRPQPNCQSHSRPISSAFGDIPQPAFPWYVAIKTGQLPGQVRHGHL